MSASAAAAFRAVLEEVGGVAVSQQWEELRRLLDGATGPTEADGAAAVHSHSAREEAARKLITNHEAVVRDVTNPSPKTQPQLTRVSTSAAPYVDQMLREVLRPLASSPNPRPHIHPSHAHVHPSSPQPGSAAAAWTAARAAAARGAA